MHDITVLRLPMQFSRSSRHFTQISSSPARGETARKIVEIVEVWDSDDSDEEDSEIARRGWGYRAALSDAIMRGGRHCAQFTFEVSNPNTMVGIVQAGSCPSAVLNAPRGCVTHRTLLTEIGSTAKVVVTHGHATREPQRTAEKMQGSNQRDCGSFDRKPCENAQ
jgi:hypothetical protein